MSDNASDDAAQAAQDPPNPGPEKKPSRTLRIVRVTAVVLLTTIGALLATVSVPAIWGRNLVLNTDRYVSTMSPLATDPGIQAGIVKAIDKQFDANVDVEALAKQVLPGKASVLAGPLQNATESLVNSVATKLVESPAFAKLWDEMNRVAHTQIVAVLTGKHSSENAVAIKNDAVTLNLGPVVDAVKKQLVSAGLSVASKVPATSATIEIAKVKGVDKARHAVRLLNRLAIWLPIIAIVLLIIAVLLSKRRRRRTIIAALSVAFGMVVLAVALAIGRKIYLNQLPGTYLTESAAKSLYNTLVRYLRDGIRIVLGAALLICLIAWLSGPSKPAQAFRRGPRALLTRWQRSRAAIAIGENRGAVAGVVFGVAALVLVLWSNPTILVVIVIGVIALVLLLLAYFSKSPHSTESSVTQVG